MTSGHRSEDAEDPLTKREPSHWKSVIRFNLLAGPLTFSDLRRLLPPSVQAHDLAAMLEELEAERIIRKRRRLKVMPDLEYALTTHGRTQEVAKAFDLSS